MRYQWITGISQHGEQVGITASFENLSDRNNPYQKLNINAEHRRYNPDGLN